MKTLQNILKFMHKLDAFEKRSAEVNYLVGEKRKLEHLPKILTDKQVDSICMSIRHDFGLVITEEEDVWLSSGMTEKERNKLRQQVREFYHAIYKEFFYIES
jgi:hypothetical protein